MSQQSRRVLVEVCVASVSDARVAETGGADRIELNAALELGGLTPSIGTLIEARQAVALPIIAMVRPRPGGFCYDKHERAAMLRDAELMLQHGADGLALGLLTADGRVDLDRCTQMMNRIRSVGVPLREGFVFHRAFDFVMDRTEALEDLIRLGFRRVMTSGAAPSAIEGAAEIAKLIRQAAGRIEVLPAGGIRGTNVRRLVELTNCDQVHASVRSEPADASIVDWPQLSLGSGGHQHFVTDARLLAQLVAALH